MGVLGTTCSLCICHLVMESKHCMLCCIVGELMWEGGGELVSIQ